MPDAHLAAWNGPAIAAECHQAWKAYRAKRTDSYRKYFAANLQLKSPRHEYSAKDLAAALPDGWNGLESLLPVSERHRYYLSGNSSQVLALGLLGVSAKLDPSLSWLWSALGALPGPASHLPKWQFENKLAPDVLDERPRQTSVDFFVEDTAALVCLEAKWTEEGIGACGCADSGGKPDNGQCSAKVLARTAYWDAAYGIFGLPARTVGQPCPLSFTYQAVRNVAAALALADDGQLAVFALIYDAENPYFAGCGAWAGWPAALRATLDGVYDKLCFRAVSWQELLPLAPLDDAARAWASEKHGLRPSGHAPQHAMRMSSRGAPGSPPSSS